MALLSREEKIRVQAAAALAEKRSCGEFVTVIAPRADLYLYIPTLWAALITLLVPAAIAYLRPDWDHQRVYATQIATFFGLSLLFRWQRLTVLLVPKRVQRGRAARMAREEFFLRGLPYTRERSGLLLFVSMAERYVEIVADKGIKNRVAQSEWDAIVNNFIDEIKQGRAADGFIAAIESCSGLLELHFPRRTDDRKDFQGRAG